MHHQTAAQKHIPAAAQAHTDQCMAGGRTRGTWRLADQAYLPGSRISRPEFQSETAVAERQGIPVLAFRD